MEFYMKNVKGLKALNYYLKNSISPDDAAEVLYIEKIKCRITE